MGRERAGLGTVAPMPTASSALSDADRELVVALARWLEEAACAYAFTGAGISTESGLPDFRSAGGVWSGVDPMREGHLHTFLNEPDRVWRFYTDRLGQAAGAEPNTGHRALAALEAHGLLRAVVTQNVDGLHQAAGSRDVLELHGSLTRARCLECDAIVAMEEALSRRHDELAPACDCGRPLKPDIVLFGEPLGPALQQAQELALESDLVLALGSSLQVRPAADLPKLTRRRGRLAIVTASRTPLDHKAQLRSSAPLGLLLAALTDELGLPRER